MAKHLKFLGDLVRSIGVDHRVQRGWYRELEQIVGEDIYQFAKAMGLESFHYAGKCHGTNPGWYLLKLIPGVRTVLLQGEKQLLEMDMPKRLAKEIDFFIELSNMLYA